LPKKRIHRVVVYLLDQHRRRILLRRSTNGPFANQYVALSAPWSESHTPVEVARNLVSRATNLDFIFLSYAPSMPMLLDERSIKTFPPLHIQITMIDAETEYIDYVYLCEAKAAPDFPPNAELGWFTQQSVKTAPSHVKHNVHHILSVVNRGPSA